MIERSPTSEDKITMIGGLQKHQTPRNDGICPCINSAAGMGGGQTPIAIRPSFRVRKLTQKECWRLMGFQDQDFERAKSAMNENIYGGADRSGSQLYKQAGNSIVVDVLCAILDELHSAMPYLFEDIKETIMPVVSFLRYVPVTAFSPLLILWFGIGEQMKISFLFIATFVYLLPSILLCFNDVPQDLMDTGKTIGMTSWETIKEILLPASLPSIFSTFLMMYGIGWTYCAVVEATNAKYGLGFIINVSSARGRTAVVFGAIIVIMLFSFVFDKLGNLLIRKIFQWRYCDDQVE